MFPWRYRNSIQYAVVVLAVLLQINEGFAGQSKVMGKFSYDSDPNDKKVHDVLLEFGFEEDDLAGIQRFNPETTKTFALSGDKILMMHKTPTAKQAQEFFNGKEAEEQYLLDKPQYKAQTTATLEGDKITFKRKLPKGKKEMTDVLECNEGGCTSNLTVGSKKATIKWKRVQEEEQR